MRSAGLLWPLLTQTGDGMTTPAPGPLIVPSFLPSIYPSLKCVSKDLAGLYRYFWLPLLVTLSFTLHYAKSCRDGVAHIPPGVFRFRVSRFTVASLPQQRCRDVMGRKVDNIDILQFLNAETMDDTPKKATKNVFKWSRRRTSESTFNMSFED